MCPICHTDHGARYVSREKGKENPHFRQQEGEESDKPTIGMDYKSSMSELEAALLEYAYKYHTYNPANSVKFQKFVKSESNGLQIIQ